MLRVKQEVHKDPRLSFSKEQLLTSLITTENHYKDLKTNLDYKANKESANGVKLTKLEAVLQQITKKLTVYKQKLCEMNEAVGGLLKK